MSRWLLLLWVGISSADEVAQQRQMAVWDARQVLIEAGTQLETDYGRYPTWVYASSESGVGMSKFQFCRLKGVDCTP